MKFHQFFRNATGHAPYPYQVAFATAETLPHLLWAPTSAGKTATAILGWLWRQRYAKQGAPRRLAYCLPMRVLVEQSKNAAQEWLKALKLEKHVAVHVLMGGVEAEDWFLEPEKPAILIGTQDMLLSRALNRGYAESRFHWPIDFGLLNNDCLWVFDEPQLMANGVSTSAQLAGLRQSLGAFGTCPSVWMSATLEPGWLDTIDFRGKFTAPALELTEDDYDEKLPLHKRMTAEKKLAELDAAWSKDMKAIAKAVAASHVQGTQTLVVVNTVERAKNLYAALGKLKPLLENVLLVHSRYRPHEREELNYKLQLKGDDCIDRIIVATQVVEAGVDISSRTLITELAPWASLVQRMGRCNRTGDDGPGKVFWIDVPDKDAPPYEADDLKFAREQLKVLEGKSVSPQALDKFKRKNKIVLPFEHEHVLRRRDLIDLFDTTPDLSGNDIDIQRFVRSDDPEMDVQIFWRNVPPSGSGDDEPAPEREELCSAPIGQCKGFLDDSKHDGYIWDHLDERWRPLRDPKRELRPGMVILVPSAAGGYSELGWDPDSGSSVAPVPPRRKELPEATGSDQSSCGPALTLNAHTQHVFDELRAILTTCGLSEECRQTLERAARWHDVGKAHPVFQATLRKVNADLDALQCWAKSGKRGRLSHERHHFRHELASALAALQHGVSFEVAYLIACHHGKVRLSIRSFPDEWPQPDNTCIRNAQEQFGREPLYAAGVWDADRFGPVVLSDSETCPATTLDLSTMLLGGDHSWTARALALRDQLGPFKLAYLEALLRAADLRASRNERLEGAHA
ncbi:MAG: CRISPR-associated helicase Cas3' [Gemmataceae bacterium]|nr:CRISPR-associated helicase Cas3' [Gemmataceae bacterium]